MTILNGVDNSPFNFKSEELATLSEAFEKKTSPFQIEISSTTFPTLEVLNYEVSQQLDSAGKFIISVELDQQSNSELVSELKK